MTRRAALALALVLLAGRGAGAEEAPASLQGAMEARAARDRAALVTSTRRLLDEDLSAGDALLRLLYGAAATGDADLLDEAVEVARPAVEKAGGGARRALGAALLARARADAVPGRALLEEAVRLLEPGDAPGEDAAAQRAALDLAYARHLLGDAAGARAAYERALRGDEPVAERAVAGLESLAGGKAEAFDAEVEALAARHPRQPAVARRRAAALARAKGPREAVAWLDAWLRAAPDVRSGRVHLDRARHLRDTGDPAGAVAAEGAAAAFGDDPVVARGVWGGFRARPLVSFADCDALERDARALLASAPGEERLQVLVRADVAFLFREVVSSFTWRGEARTQGVAEGAPPQARALLDRCVALYEEALERVPKDVADRSFAERWAYAGVCNDAGLMRHYFVDTRDLGKAEALYRRAFDLTDGAYMDAYYYNLQYLYGFELPGREETWLRLARRASEAILRETADGGFEPDERKREAARRDAAGLEARLAARDAPR